MTRFSLFSVWKDTVSYCWYLSVCDIVYINIAIRCDEGSV